MKDIKSPKKIAENTYWLGMRRNVRLESNTYLRVFEGQSRPLVLMIDPGGPNIFKRLLKHFHDTLGHQHKLRLVFLSDYAPDVGINIVYLLKHTPELIVLCTDEVWRLAYALGISSGRFQSVEKLHNGCISLPSGDKLRFLPVPFCPSRGSCMLYDEQSRILFSGGLFGGITFTPSLVATSEHWEGIRMWHQMYIATHEALQRAIRIVRELDPPPEMIAPQHGAILNSSLIPIILDKLSALPVGVDLSQATEIDKLMYLEAINDVLETIAKQAGRDVIENLLHRLDKDRSFPPLFTVQQGKLTDIRDDILGDALGAFKLVMYALIQEQPSSIQEIVRNAIIQSSWDLSTFMQTLVHRKRK